ncbi:CLUMA_CG003233, isoform A [Clunio marinus]|uniref:CLUMA_CG003233, isoform A n=1 Tax=Clunio marinus TaxID=568069 RepID=A0A1J1HPN8_9DIPT|nr:CLUMA_CG003233, isoform A [Clunio marinus]
MPLCSLILSTQSEEDEKWLGEDLYSKFHAQRENGKIMITIETNFDIILKNSSLDYLKKKSI